MVERTPVFELHIRPLFRPLDRQHMLRVRPDLDLWSYDAVKNFAPAIQKRVGPPTPSMPTPSLPASGSIVQTTAPIPPSSSRRCSATAP